ncbi:MAG: hypothetical protein H0U76_11135 [Ktedonobacteraceae bacterium]|nr:hypothetical protein [Ktedonobacteraceae bacterium]
MTTPSSNHPSPYTSLPEEMSEQDWRNIVSLLLLRVKELEARLRAVEKHRSEVLERVPVEEQAPATPL